MLARMENRLTKTKAAQRARRRLVFSPPMMRPSYETKMPARFANRESFESFAASTEQWAGAAPSFQVYFGDGTDMVNAVSVDGVLRSTDHRIDFLSVTTLKGEMRFDSRQAPSIQVFPHNPDLTAECGTWVAIAQRYLRPIPWLMRWRRYSIVTGVRAGEIRDTSWKLRVTWLAATLGGIFGFLGGLLSAVLTAAPPQ